MKLILNNNLWQVGTGDSTRSYFDVFLQYGVALVGPGDPGKEGMEDTAHFYQTNPKANNWGAVLKRLDKGHWIIARSGKTRILGVGKVTSEYNFSDLFEDIEGWDLHHFVRVKWYTPLNKDKILELSDSTMRWVTISECNNQEAKNLISNSEFEEIEPIVKDNWKLPEKLEIREITDALIEYGIRIQDAENISNIINRIIKLTKWYEANDYKVLEHELRAFLIIPLLISLGWSEQKIKLEYNRIDVALFDEPFKGDYKRSPELILEAKTFDNGLAFTQGQIKRYGEMFPECSRFVITNGFRYRYFEKENGELKEKGYFNLLRLRKTYAIRQYSNEYSLTIQTMLKIANF